MVFSVATAAAAGNCRGTSIYHVAGAKESRKLRTISLIARASSSNLATGLVAAAMVLSVAAIQAPPLPETLSNVPQMLSGECLTAKDCKKARIQRPKSRKAESCTIKCVTTCIRGGAGSPGEGPLTARRPLVVFKQSFRSRQYCLVECSDICNLMKDNDGP